jgi:hypothetical protein
MRSVLKKIKPTDQIEQGLLNLAEDTLTRGAIPSRTKIASELGRITGGFIKNPVKAIKEGVQREKLMREYLTSKTGVELPSKLSLVGQGMKKGAGKLKNYTTDYLSDPAKAKDLAVNTSGYIGSKIGAVGGLPGQLAGDFLGAATMRKALVDVDATKNALRKLRTTQAFKEASKLDKIKQLQGASIHELKLMQQDIKATYKDDIAGWAVGNSFAETAPIPLPFKGFCS